MRLSPVSCGRSASTIGVACLALCSVTHMEACGASDDLAGPTSVYCGEGTVQVGGACVPIEAGVGGSGGAAGQSGEGGTAPAGAGGGGTGGQGGQPDADVPDLPLDGPVEGGPGPNDDPCPSEPLFLNCSDSCGPKDTAKCELAECGDDTQAVVVSDPEAFPIVIRTPSAPGASQKCKTACTHGGSVGWAGSIMVKMKVFPNSYDAGVYSYGHRITVPPPWRMITLYSVDPWSFCSDYFDVFPGSCLAGNTEGQYDIEIVTDDPAAPSRNVTIERLPTPVKCP